MFVRLLSSLNVAAEKGYSQTRYYPFGLTMAGISSKALNFGNPQNKYKFNGIEGVGEFDLQDLNAKFREYDPQIGRWWEVDPKTDKMEMWSPYAAMYDNPIRFNDPLGDEPDGDDKYKVRHGDNLTNIARTNNTTVDAILKANTNIGDPNEIQIGQEIIIPRVSSNQNKIVMSSLARWEPSSFKNIPIMEVGVGGRWGILIKEFFKKFISTAGKESSKLYSEAMYKAFEKQLASDGLKSILKSQRNIETRLAEHIQKLAEIKKAGGFSSSVEREIKTFKSQLEAIKDLLKK